MARVTFLPGDTVHACLTVLHRAGGAAPAGLPVTVLVKSAAGLSSANLCPCLPTACWTAMGSSAKLTTPASSPPMSTVTGWKAVGDLSYIGKDAPRRIHLLTLGPDLRPVASPALTQTLIITRQLSVLTKLGNGSYAYISTPKREELGRTTLPGWRWFRSPTRESVQTILVPDGLEGTAYVQASFVRDMDSPEVFMSPLSYSIQPFRLGAAPLQNLAIVDLLPGGWEVEQGSLHPGPGGAPGADSVDMREDRNIIYCSVSGQQTQQFTVPPAFANSLYRPAVQARSPAGKLTALPR